MDEKNFLLYEYEDVGEARATVEVMAKIACLAATEVEGVDSLNGMLREHIDKAGKKNLASCIRIVRTDGQINIAIAIVVKMGYSITEISKAIQEKVKAAIENMTGIRVGAVNIDVVNLKIEK